MAASRFSLQLLPLAIFAIVLGTMVPVELRAALGWNGGFEAMDFVQNLLLFAPLGFALAHRRAWVAISVAAAFSLTAEVLQIWQFERFPSPWDVAANVLGAHMAAYVRRLWLRRSGHMSTHIAINGWWLLITALSLAALTVLWQWPAKSSAIAGWERDYALLLGNERTNDRPWRGSIHELTLLNRALSRDAIQALSSHPDQVEHQQSVLYRTHAPTELNGGPAVQLSQEASRLVADQIMKSGEFTVIARIQVADLDQNGPARIISFSAGRRDRNFDIGQVRDRIAFRVRTPASGKNGDDFRAETDSILATNTPALIVATYDGAVERIYVNGRAHARSNLAATGCAVRELCDSALPLSWAMFGAMVATICLALGRWAGRAQAAIVCALAGTVAVGAGKFFSLLPDHALAQTWIVLMAAVGAMVVAAAYKPKCEPH
jgi:VanZ like family/Concanavalin A-like lectin/glucanases superfamily